VAALLALLLLLCGAPAGAQGRQAVLQRGPLPGRGIPFFPPNLLPVYRGEYLAGEFRIEVFFTREALGVPAGWRRASCGTEPLLRLPEEEKPTYCLLEGGETGFGVFLSFDSEAFPWCAWTEAFLRRLRNLLAFSREEIPFPAILDY